MPSSSKPYSLPWKVREICPALEIRQFEFNPCPRYSSIIACGTTTGHIALLDYQKNTVIGSARDTGKFATDSVLGIAWLQTSRPGYFISGTSEGAIRLFNGEAVLDDYLANPSFDDPLPYTIPDELSFNEYMDTIVNHHQQHKYYGLRYPAIPDIPVVQSYTVYTNPNEENELTCVHLSCDDRYGLRSGHSQDVKIFDIATGQVTYTIENAHTKYINISRFAKLTPNLVATSSYDAEVALWDIRQPSHTQKALYRVTSLRGNITIAFDPYDQYLLTCAIDNEVRCYNLSDGKQYSRMAIPETGRTDNYTRAYFADDGHHILSGASEEPVFRINSVATGELLSTSTLYDNKHSASLYIQSLRGAPNESNFYAMLATYRDSTYPIRLITVDGNAERVADPEEDGKEGLEGLFSSSSSSSSSSIVMQSMTERSNIAAISSLSSSAPPRLTREPLRHWGRYRNSTERMYTQLTTSFHTTPSREWFAQIWDLCMQAQGDGGQSTVDTYTTGETNNDTLPKKGTIGTSGADITLISDAVYQPDAETRNTTDKSTEESTVRVRATLHLPILTVRLPLLSSLFAIQRKDNPHYFCFPRLFMLPSSLRITPSMLQVITTYAYSDILVWPTFPPLRLVSGNKDETKTNDSLLSYLGMSTEEAKEARETAVAYLTTARTTIDDSVITVSELHRIFRSTLPFRPSHGRWNDVESSLRINGVNYPMIGPLVPLNRTCTESSTPKLPSSFRSSSDPTYRTVGVTDATKDPRLLLQLWHPFHFFDYHNVDPSILKAHESSMLLEQQQQQQAREDEGSTATNVSSSSSSSSFAYPERSTVSSTVGWQGASSSLYTSSSSLAGTVNTVSPHFDESLRIHRILEGLCSTFQAAAVFGVPRLAHLAVAEVFTDQISSAILQPSTVLPLIRIALAFGALWPINTSEVSNAGEYESSQWRWPFAKAWKDYKYTTGKDMLTLMYDMWKASTNDTNTSLLFSSSVVPAATELLLCTLHYGFTNYPLLHSLGVWDELQTFASDDTDGNQANKSSSNVSSRRRQLSPDTSPSSMEKRGPEKRSRGTNETMNTNVSPFPVPSSVSSAYPLSYGSSSSTNVSSVSSTTVSVRYTFMPVTLKDISVFMETFYTNHIRQPLPINYLCEDWPNSSSDTINYEPEEYEYDEDYTKDMEIELKITENAIHDTLQKNQSERETYLRRFKEKPNPQVYTVPTDPKTKRSLMILPFRAYAKEADPLWRHKLHASMYVPRLQYHRAVMVTVPNMHKLPKDKVQMYSMQMMIFGGINRHQANPSQIPLALTCGSIRYNSALQQIEPDPLTRNTDHRPVWYKSPTRGTAPQKIVYSSNAPLTPGVSRFIVFYGHNTTLGTVDNVTPGSMVWLDPATWKTKEPMGSSSSYSSSLPFTTESRSMIPRITSPVLSIPFGSLHSPDELMDIPKPNNVTNEPILLPLVYPPPQLSSLSAITALSFGKIYLYDSWTHTWNTVTPDPDLAAPCGNDFTMFAKWNSRTVAKVDSCAVPFPRVGNTFVLWENDGHLSTVPMHNNGVAVASSGNGIVHDETYYHHIVYGGSYSVSLPKDRNQVPASNTLGDLMVLVTTVRNVPSTNRNDSGTELSFSWLRPTVTPNAVNYQPAARTDHAACILPLPDADGGPIMFVHGGRGNRGHLKDNPVLALNGSVEQYRVSSNAGGSISSPSDRSYTKNLQFQWHNPVVFGSAPLARSRHTVTSIASTLAPLPSSLLVPTTPSASPFSAAASTVHDSLYKDITCRTAIVYGGELYIGSYSQINNTAFNDLYVVTVTRAPTTKEYIVTWSQPVTLSINRSLSNGPIGRHSHTAVYAPSWSTPSFVHRTDAKTASKETTLVTPIYGDDASSTVFPVDRDAAFRCEVAGIKHGTSDLTASSPLAITIPGSILIFGGQDAGIHRNALNREYLHYRIVRHQALRNWMAFVENQRRSPGADNFERNKSLPVPYPRRYDRDDLDDDGNAPFLFDHPRLNTDTAWRIFCRKDINHFERDMARGESDPYVDENIHVLKLTIAPDIRTIAPKEGTEGSLPSSSPSSSSSSSPSSSSSSSLLSSVSSSFPRNVRSIGGRYSAIRVTSNENSSTGTTTSRTFSTDYADSNSTVSILDCLSPVQRYLTYALLHPLQSLLETLPVYANGNPSSPSNSSTSANAAQNAAEGTPFASLGRYFGSSNSGSSYSRSGTTSTIASDTQPLSLRLNDNEYVDTTVLKDLVSLFLQSINVATPPSTERKEDPLTVTASSLTVIRTHIAQLLSLVWSRVPPESMKYVLLKFIRENTVPSNNSSDPSAINRDNIIDNYGQRVMTMRCIESQRIATLLGYCRWLENMVRYEPIPGTLRRTNDMDEWLIGTLPVNLLRFLQRKVVGGVPLPLRTVSTLYAIEYTSVRASYPMYRNGESLFMFALPYESSSLQTMQDNLQEIKTAYRQSLTNPTNGTTTATTTNTYTGNFGPDTEQQRNDLLPYALPLHTIAEWSQPVCYMNDAPSVPVPPVPLSSMVSDFTQLVDQSMNLTFEKNALATTENSPPGTDMVIHLQNELESLSSSSSSSSSPSLPNTLATYRWLLRNRSPFFEVLFGTNENTYRESTTGTVHLPPDEALIVDTVSTNTSNENNAGTDTDSKTTEDNARNTVETCHRETMIRLLHYLITDTLHPLLNPIVGMNLFIMAYRLSLPRLALLIEAYLIKWIDKENVCGLYQFMDEITNLFSEPIELTDNRVPTGKHDTDLEPSVPSSALYAIVRTSTSLRFQPSNVSLNTTGGMGRSLRSACISFLLREYANMVSSSSTSSSSSSSSTAYAALYTDYLALPDHLRKEIQSLWDTQNHAYSYSRTTKKKGNHN